MEFIKNSYLKQSLLTVLWNDKYIVKILTTHVIKKRIFITTYRYFHIDTGNKDMSLKTVLTLCLKYVNWYSTTG